MLHKTAAAAFTLLLASSAVVKAADPCPCIPVTHLWTVVACDTWTCAAAALADAGGDPNIFVIPSSNEEHRWLIMKRVVAGTAAQSTDGPFTLEQFTKMVDGSVRFDSIDGAQAPMLVTAYDHAVLVVYLREAPVRRRAVGH